MNTLKRNLTRVIAILAILAVLACVSLFSGCAPKGPKMDVREIDTTRRAPTETVDVFRNGEAPKRSVKDFAEFSYEASNENAEEVALSLFLPEARKRGAQVIITDTHVSRTVQHGDFGRETFRRVKARVAVYD